MKKSERTEWGKIVIEQLKQIADIKTDQFTILAGQNYISPLENYLSNMILPLKGLPIGKRLQFLNQQIGEV